MEAWLFQRVRYRPSGSLRLPAWLPTPKSLVSRHYLRPEQESVSRRHSVSVEPKKNELFMVQLSITRWWFSSVFFKKTWIFIFTEFVFLFLLTSNQIARIWIQAQFPLADSKRNKNIKIGGKILLNCNWIVGYWKTGIKNLTSKSGKAGRWVPPVAEVRGPTPS